LPRASNCLSRASRWWGDHARGETHRAIARALGIFYHLEFYPDDELVKIINRSAAILRIPTEPEGAMEIACRSRGTPRIANRLLRRVRDFAEVKADGVITRAIADDALKAQGSMNAPR